MFPALRLASTERSSPHLMLLAVAQDLHGRFYMRASHANLDSKFPLCRPWTKFVQSVTVNYTSLAVRLPIKRPPVGLLDTGPTHEQHTRRPNRAASSRASGCATFGLNFNP